MPVNFQALQGIQAPQVIAELPEEQPSSGGGIGGIFKALAGIASGVMGKPKPGASIGAERGAQGFGVGGMVPDAGGFQNAGGSYGGQSAVPGLQQQGSGGINHSYDSITKQFLGKTEVGDTKALSGFFQQSLGVNIDPRNVPWCGAFAGSVIQSSGYAAPKNPLAARSYLNFGQPTDQPKIGDLVVLGRGPGLGHVGFYNGLDAQGRPTMLSGNHDNGVGIGTFDTSRVLGYRTAPSAQELQSKPSPMAMTQQATQRAFNDPAYAAKIVKEHSMISPSQMSAGPTQASQLSNMSGNQQMIQQQYKLDNPNSALDETMAGIYHVETGRDGGDPYKAMGPKTHGGRAVGKYQIMTSNIPSWTKAATGKAMTPEEFRNNPQAQEQTAAYQINQSLAQGYSPEDAASIWFSGRPRSKAGKSRDAFGTDVPTYVKVFNEGRANFNQGRQPTQYANNSGTIGSQEVQSSLGQPQAAAPASPIPVQAPPRPDNSMAQRAVQGLRNFTGMLPEQPGTETLRGPTSIGGVRGEAGQGVNWGLLQALIQQQQKEQA